VYNLFAAALQLKTLYPVKSSSEALEVHTKSRVCATSCSETPNDIVDKSTYSDKIAN
jgi:hypothetical protein